MLACSSEIFGKNVSIKIIEKTTVDGLKINIDHRSRQIYKDASLLMLISDKTKQSWRNRVDPQITCII